MNAQEKPDQYATLQVRVCGWNVYFVNLSKSEQDEFIRHARHVAV
jgi:pyruvate-formate lyase